jgi:aminomethyltransferase
MHRDAGAKLVPFAGYEMPLQYSGGILREHLHTREAASLFDVSHMGQVRLDGDGSAAALEGLVPVDVVGLKPYRQRYALFTNEAGGILDDLMITHAGDHLALVVNAACKNADLAHLEAGLGASCRIEHLPEQALLALQGPTAARVMADLAPDTADMRFMDARRCRVGGVDCFLTRSGYTGEDGFEISVAAADAATLAGQLLADESVAWAGLGARDSLRLEAGLCLYGQDIDETTTPVEAGLTWAIQKVRRAGGQRAGGFPGAPRILEQLAEGTDRRRVGVRPLGRQPVRAGAELTDGDGRSTGRITSGCHGATVGGPVAMGYVNSDLSAVGTTLNATVRGKPLPVEIAKLPFVAQRYHRG